MTNSNRLGLDYAELETLAESFCAAINTRRDGIVWAHSVLVRDGKKCPTVIELESAGKVKGWAELVVKELTSRGLRVAASKCRDTYMPNTPYGCSPRKDGLCCWISILGAESKAA